MLSYVNASHEAIQHHPVSSKNVITALNDIHKRHEMKPNDECYLVSTDWIKKLDESSTTSAQSINVIDNLCLVDYQTGKIKNGLKFEKHFRLVDKTTWESIFRMFGSTLVLYFLVPEGLVHEDTRSRWGEKIKFDTIDLKIIHPTKVPLPLMHHHLDDAPSRKSNENILTPVRKDFSVERRSLTHAEISIIGYDIVKRRKGSSKLSALFVIQIIPPASIKATPLEIKRDYGEFRELNNLVLKFRKRSSKVYIPNFPSEGCCPSLQSLDSKFLETRRSQLERYLHILADQEDLWNSIEMKTFFRQEVAEFNMHSMESERVGTSNQALVYPTLELSAVSSRNSSCKKKTEVSDTLRSKLIEDFLEEKDDNVNLKDIVASVDQTGGHDVEGDTCPDHASCTESRSSNSYRPRIRTRHRK